MFLDIFRVLSRIYCLEEKSLSNQKAMSFLGGSGVCLVKYPR